MSFFQNSILSKLSIRLLVIMLAALGIIATIFVSYFAYISTQHLSDKQDDLIDVSAIQEYSAIIGNTLINFQNRQAGFSSVKDLDALSQVSDKSELMNTYQAASNQLLDLSQGDANLNEVVGQLSTPYEKFIQADESIFSNTKKRLELLNQIFQLTLDIDTQLNDIDTLINTIIGKQKFESKRTKRKIKRLINKDELINDPTLTEQLVKQVSASILGKNSNVLETANDIKNYSLNLAAFARQIFSTNNVDTMLNLRQNKINQILENTEEKIKLLIQTLEESPAPLELTKQLQKKLGVFINTAFTDKNSIYELQLKIIENKKQHKALSQTASDNTNALNSSMKALSMAVLETRNEISSQSKQQINSSKTLNISISLTVIVLLALLGMLIVAVINKPLNDVSTALHEIALGEGDLTKRLNTDGIHEVAKIAKEFNQFVEKISATIREVDDASSSLTTSSETLKKVSNQTKQDIEAQQKETKNTVIAMTEMTKTAKEIATNAEKARLYSQNVRSESESSNTMVIDVVTNIQALANQIDQSTNTILDLEKLSKSISTVLDVIRSIAEQTNLLALNAAIEAARAGEQGRGFAVVADEVRSLASRTQESAIEIEQMIKQLQNGVKNSAQSIQSGNKNASDAVEQANLAARSLKLITESITSISDMNTQIASAAEQQSAVSQEIDSNVDKVQQIGTSTVKGADEIAQSGQGLSKLSQRLQTLMSQFKV